VYKRPVAQEFVSANAVMDDSRIWNRKSRFFAKNRKNRNL